MKTITTSTNYSLVLFDFDDTLFLKKKRAFISNIVKLLRFLQNRSIDMMIVTCNKKAKDIITQQGLDVFFRDIIHVDTAVEYKSDNIHRTILRQVPVNQIIFFDNDPLHVYDVSKNCNIRSFLVNPEVGIRYEVVSMLITSQYRELRAYLNRGLQGGRCASPIGVQTVEKLTSMQNLMELDNYGN